MKYFIRTYITDENEETTYTEKEVVDLATAEKDIKVTEKLHICRHDENLPCSLI